MTANITTRHERCEIECGQRTAGEWNDVMRCPHGRLWIVHVTPIMGSRFWMRIYWFEPIRYVRAVMALRAEEDA